MEIISSRTNSKIKRARALRQRKGREADGAYLVEGIHHVGAALEAGAPIEVVFYAPEMLEGEFAQSLIESVVVRSIPCHATTPDVLTSLADKENPQGLLAVVRQQPFYLSELKPENFSWGAALVTSQDPGNVGSILRTIDAVGASGLLLLEGGVDPYHPTSVRASMGAIFRLPVVSVPFAGFSRWAAEGGYHVYGSSAHGVVDYRSISEYQKPLILLMGSEREGLTSEQAAICEAVVRMPMHGKVTSLNLAVAAGVLLFTILDQQHPAPELRGEASDTL